MKKWLARRYLFSKAPLATDGSRPRLEQAREILQTTDRALKLARKAARAQAGHIAIGFVGGAETRVFVHILPILLEKYRTSILRCAAYPSRR